MPTQLTNRVAWRMELPCDNCPFADDAAIKRWSMEIFRPARWQKLKEGLLAGEHFICHKTTPQTGNGSNLVCAGAIRWQAEHDVVANYVQVCERLEKIYGK